MESVLKNRLVLSVGIILVGFVSCQSSPQAKEARALGRAKKELAQKDYSRAFLELKNAVQAMPKDAEPYYQIGLVYLGRGEFRGALASFQKASELDPKRTDAQLKVAEIMGRFGNAEQSEEAHRKLEGILAANTKDPEVLDAIGALEFRSGRTDDALKRLEDALQKFPTDFRSTIELTEMKLRKNDPAGAEAVLRQAVARAPQSVPIAIALGSLYEVAGKTAEAEAEFARACQLDPKNGTALMSLARFQAARKQLAEADQTYRRLAALADRKYRFVHAAFAFRYQSPAAGLAEMEPLAKADPGSQSARNLLIFMYMQTGKTEQVRRLVADALKRNPKDTDALIQKGSLELQAGNPSEAQTALQQVLRLHPDLAEAHYLTAAAYRAQRQPKNEADELRKALRFNNSLLPARLELSQLLRGARDYNGALELLNGAGPNQKQLLPWMIERNWALYLKGDLPELKSALKQALLKARTPELLYQSALVSWKEGNYSGARALGEEILTAAPDNVEAARLVADSYAAQKQPAKGTEWFRAMAAARPQSGALQVALGQWLRSQGNFAEARNAFERAKIAAPADVAADVELATLDYRDKRLAAALDRLLAVVRRDPTYEPALLILGELEDAMGQREAAVAEFRAALATNDKSTIAMANLAYDLAIDQPEEALQFAQRAAELAPDNSSALDAMGLVLYRKRLYDAAEDYLKRAVSRQPTPKIRFHLAMLYMKSGKSAQAQQLLANALHEDPTLAQTENAWQ